MDDIVGIATAVAIVYVAWRQWLTDRRRLQHELFDRRYAIYEATANYLGRVVRTGTVDHSEYIELLRQTRISYFVFSCDESMKSFLEELGLKASQLETVNIDLKTGQAEDRTSAVGVRRELFQWHVDALVGLDARFATFLKLSH